MLATLDRQWSFVEVSPDGQWIVVADGRDVGLLPVSKQGSPRSLLATRAVEQSPAISPDGRWLAYASNESGRVEIYVRPVPDVAAAKWQVSTSGGSTPAWSTTRPELYYVSNEGQFIAAELRTNPTFEVLDRRTLFSTRPFEGLAGARFTYVADPGGDRFLALRPIGGAAAEQLVLVEGLSRLLRGSSAR
jgi:serine/threonine-protein kinase